ncbi:MAG: M20/M25/M40 family metallo-hydrolase, partial [Sphingomonas sp.]|nr:M20/M25/M40 family metallo-hydrolase [Sphingomonas sp.]
MRPTLLLSALLVALLAGLTATALLIQPPPVRSEAKAGQFDAARAKARLAAILGDERPHPTDTAGDDAVRARLVGQIRAIGLNAIVRDQFACNSIFKTRGVSCARVRNVIVALGPTSGKAILLNAHYDSSFVGPGAADDGVGVATLLEIASILKNEPLQRPILLLFNEGEEVGLIGARAFLADPLSHMVDSLINLESRGTTGPVSMFETSLPNGPPVRALARSVERPFANSLATDFYRQLPNYTDVNSFSERGWTILNFAMVGNETRYHSAGDTLAALDPRSLQHMGDQALALTRELAGNAPGASGGSVLFADIAGHQLIVIPEWLGFVLLGLLAIGFACLAWRRGGLWRGLATVVVALVASGAIAFAALYLMGLLRPESFWRAYPVWTHIAVYACGLLGAVAALALIARRLTVEQLRTSYWLGFLLLGVAMLLAAPGGVIYFLLPPLLAVSAILLSRWLPVAERAGTIAAALFLWLTLGEVVALLGQLLNNGPFFIFAPLATLIFMPWLIEAKALVEESGRLRAVAAASVLMLAGWAGVAAAPAYSADRQQRFTIQHVTDTGTGRAYWSVAKDSGPPPDKYGGTGEWKYANVPYTKRKRWLAPAP